MAQQKHSELAFAGGYTFHDDSRQAKVLPGARFLWPEQRLALSALASSAAYPFQTGVGGVEVMRLLTRNSIGEIRQWVFSTQRYGDMAHHAAQVEENGHAYTLAVDEGYGILCSPVDICGHLPESIFGCLMGLATGLMEAERLLRDQHKRGIQAHFAGAGHDPRHDWRALRYSFAMRTAVGSPFAEQWSFSIQEAVRQENGFRIWIEQQRTGRELYVRLRSNGSIENIQELEQLPAAIHGAGLGMLCAFHFLQQQYPAASEGLPQKTFA